MSKPKAKTKKAKAKLTYNDILMHVSGNFLCENLPDEWGEWEEEQVNQFLVDNAWQPFEYWEPHEIWEVIEDACLALIQFLKEFGIEVEK